MFAIGFGSFRVLTRSYYPASETRLLRSYGRVFYTQHDFHASRNAQLCRLLGDSTLLAPGIGKMNHERERTSTME